MTPLKGMRRLRGCRSVAEKEIGRRGPEDLDMFAYGGAVDIRL